ncbi:MAG: fumarylacetoacetate hydrolase family protein [Actinomycetota bacterium]|nr:fumarylacetoacetate hydrolase family protein [Actinomycetota bacterium]
MKLARLGDPGLEKPVLITDAGTYDLSGIVPDLGPAAFATGGLARIRAAAEQGGLPEVADAASLRVGSPIARPGAIYCIGQNYAAHAAESGNPPPHFPIVFLKPPNTVVGPYDEVDIPRGSARADWEVELGIVIGEPALYLESPDAAAAHIAGYVTADDLSERDFQQTVSGGQWSKGKSAPGFAPLGPWFVTADEFDPSDVRLRSWVNGEPRQDSTSADMIFDVNVIVHHLSQYLALEPGDLILTGTPQGVAMSGNFPYLKAGDVVEIEVDGLGRQRTVFGQA